MVLLDLASEQPVVAKVRFKYHLLPQSLTFHEIASPLHQVLDGVPEGWCPALAVFWSGGVAGVAYRFETDMFLTTCGSLSQIHRIQVDPAEARQGLLQQQAWGDFLSQGWRLD